MLPDTHSHDTATDATNHQMLRRFEQFLELADSGALFDGADDQFLMSLRQAVAAALHRLLVWDRPWLEAQRGILWPYQELAQRYRRFQQLAEDATDPLRQQQAALCLALLPFPRQWQWLLRVEEQFGAIPELRAFQAAEAGSMADKIDHKPQNPTSCSTSTRCSRVFELAKGILRVSFIPAGGASSAGAVANRCGT
jgi:hypothetical protein